MPSIDPTIAPIVTLGFGWTAACVVQAEAGEGTWAAIITLLIALYGIRW